MATIPKNKFMGKPLKPCKSEDHFIRCATCGGYIDCRDLGAVFAHEGPLPHPVEDQPQ